MLTNYLALDVGRARVGLALANSVARLAAPLPALPHDDKFWLALHVVIAENDVNQIVIGWPRGLEGQATDQTRYIEEFAQRAKDELELPVALQDEALTSVKAQAELESRGGVHSKGDIDSLSAVYILEDYLAEGVH